MNHKTIVITGASSGIGESLAYSLAKEQMNLVLFARRESRLQKVAQRCRNLGASLVCIQVGDVSKKENIIALKEKVSTLPGEIVLVNNAGVFRSEYFDQMSLEVMEEMIQINLLGVFYMTHALLPVMLERRGGQIINISSIAAKNSFLGCSIYSATKAGLLSFSQILAKEVRSKGIRVCTVLPGMTNTEIWSNLDEKTKTRILSAELVSEMIKDLIFLSKAMTVDEITLTPPEGTL